MDIPVGSQDRMFSEHRHLTASAPFITEMLSSQELLCLATPEQTNLTCLCPKITFQTAWDLGLTPMCKSSKEDFLFWLSRDSGWQASIDLHNFSDQFKQREGLKLYKPTRLQE